MNASLASLEGRVAIVTGAGRGIGRATALALASRGARVLVNDLGTSIDGSTHNEDPATEVVAAIEAAGGEAVSNSDSVSDWPSAQRIIESALDRFGQIDFLVNNAGLSAGGPILYPEARDMLVQPVAPHTGLREGLIFPEHSVIELRARGGVRPTLSVDGSQETDLASDERVIVRRGPHLARFLRGQDPVAFYTALTRRLGLVIHPGGDAGDGS